MDPVSAAIVQQDVKLKKDWISFYKEVTGSTVAFLERQYEGMTEKFQSKKALVIRKYDEERLKLDEDRKKFDMQKAKYDSERKKFDIEKSKFDCERRKFEAEKKKFDAEKKKLEAKEKQFEAKVLMTEALELERDASEIEDQTREPHQLECLVSNKGLAILLGKIVRVCHT